MEAKQIAVSREALSSQIGSMSPKMKSTGPNETETVNLIEQVINPYITDKRKELGLPADQKALLTWDVFRGQVDH